MQPLQEFELEQVAGGDSATDALPGIPQFYWED